MNNATTQRILNLTSNTLISELSRGTDPATLVTSLRDALVSRFGDDLGPSLLRWAAVIAESKAVSLGTTPTTGRIGALALVMREAAAVA